ncbi:MAG: hypothetical protein OEL56_00790 [Nitrosopumilus sp.]|nr:hypothetical protein [Nitrosopumilus sp.]MDH3515353.1 hypothetical protein [Nitrosopumilus sp.]MDH3564346.1 hypothetical protein [Nitrosopumilus sp.]MDH5554984.1 hypothetical protein [Nitrosopumilus sp.]
MIPKWMLIIFAALFVISFSPSYAQHHSGALSPPIDLDGLKVSLSTILSPADFNYNETKNANLSIRFFDSDTNANIKSVTYRVQIFQENNLVANEYFFDDDGKLDLDIRPTTGCKEQNLWKCTKYFGEKHAIAGAYYARGDSIPVIQGPVFNKSGEYNVKVSIVGATNPKTMTVKDLLFETFLHIPQKETFLIKTANAQEFPISIKSYNKISNFNYDESLKKIEYEIPYHNEYDQQHDSGNTQIISMEKDFLTFKQGYGVNVFVEGIKLHDSSFEFDTSLPDENIIRINISHEELVLIESNLGSENKKDTINVEIFSGEKIEFNHLDFTFENDFTAKVLWDSKLRAGEKTSFTFSFFDVNTNPAKDILFAYSITDSSGKEIWSNVGSTETHIGILAPNGIATESIIIPSDGKFQLKLILTGQGSKNFEKFLTSVSDFSIISKSVTQEEKIIPIPTWIKNNAKWWSDGQIDDNSFIEGIQFLIQEGLMKIQITEQNTVNQSNKIPDWVKSNAGWWSDDLISERDFVKGIEFLVSQGIIKVN